MFQKYTFPKFKPYLKEINSDLCSCGGHLVSIVSGIPLKYIHALHKKNDDWRFEWVEAFLNLAGYSLKVVPQNFYYKRRGFKNVFLPNHLLLLVVAIDRNTSTWAVCYKGKIYHGGSPFQSMDGFSVFLNYPIELICICYPSKHRIIKR